MQTLKEVRRLPLSTVLLACVAAAAVSAITVALLFGGSSGDSPQTTPETMVLRPGGSSVGQPVPDTPYEDLGTGEQTDLTAYRGRPVVLNFFASWCVPCVTEMPAFEAVHQQLGDQVAFVGLATRDERDKTEELVEQTGVTYDLGRDPRGDVLVALGGTNLPTTVLIDADGNVTSLNTGELDAEALTTLIQTELLA